MPTRQLAFLIDRFCEPFDCPAIPPEPCFTDTARAKRQKAEDITHQRRLGRLFCPPCGDEKVPVDEQPPLRFFHGKMTEEVCCAGGRGTRSNRGSVIEC